MSTFHSSTMQRGAVLSPCKKYRYQLSRQWGDLLSKGKPGYVAFCMLNPSTADDTIDDRTICRCMRFSQAWGWTSMIVVNLFAFRSTDPRAMKKEPDPIGPDNDLYILSAAENAELFVCAWGNDGLYRGRSTEVQKIIASKTQKIPMRLGPLTDSGCPRHPLYLSSDLTPSSL